MDIQQLLTAGQNVALWIGVSTLIMAAAVTIYTVITPHCEWKLIREKQAAGGASLAGMLIGFALPMACVIIQTHKIADLMMWAAFALIVQIFVFWMVSILFRFARISVGAELKAGNVAMGIALCGASIAGGIINAAVLYA